MIKLIPLLPLLMLLTSCTSISEVVPAGPGKYMLSGTNLAIGASGSKIKTDLYKKASDYCISQDGIFEPVDSSSVDYRVFRGTANSELTFSCLPR
jgi:hypothetical protein